jgi:hypothetical protein
MVTSGLAPVSGAGGGGTSQGERQMLQGVAPELLEVVDEALDQHVVAGTRSDYSAHVAVYEEFCAAYGLQPFPTSAFKLGAWALRLMSRIQPGSLKSYLAAVMDKQVLLGHPWQRKGDPTLRCIIRFVKRKYAQGPPKPKVAITVSAFQRILPLLPGWPNPGDMEYDDLVFAAAVVIGVMGFLRGGEFLYRPNQSRPVLLWDHLQLDTIQGKEVMVVKVP